MTASPVRLPLSTHNRRRRAVDITCNHQSDKSSASTMPLKEKMHAFPQPDCTASENRQDVQEETSSNNSNSIFRSTWLDDQRNDLEDMWTLKRANPISEEEEDELHEEYASPPKRTRTNVLSWKQRILDDDDDEPIVLLSSVRIS